MFWHRVVRDSLVDTGRFYGLGSRLRAVVSALSFVAAVFALRLLPGGSALIADQLRWTAAVTAVALLSFFPVFGWHLVNNITEVVTDQRNAMEQLQRQMNQAVEEHEVDPIIARLEAESVSIWVDGKRESSSAEMAFDEIVGLLGSPGVTPIKGEFIHGMNYWGLTKLMSILRREGLVDVMHAKNVDECGNEYLIPTYVLNDRGAGVHRRLEEQWSIKYAEC